MGRLQRGNWKMSESIVIGYDGSDGAKKALDFAAGLAKDKGCRLVLAHVLEWSPYSFLTPTELEERHKRRTEELERADKTVVGPVLADLQGQGVDVTASVKYGNVIDTICGIAKDEEAGQIVIGRTGHTSLSSRLFGSVAGSLAQIAPVPVTIVP